MARKRGKEEGEGLGASSTFSSSFSPSFLPFFLVCKGGKALSKAQGARGDLSHAHTCSIGKEELPSFL